MATYLETKEIFLDQIELASWHPRKVFEDIEAIGESISEKGQMQPICVTPRADKFIIAFGGRRMKGAQIKGLKTIRAEVWDLTDLELKFWQARELYHTDSLRDSPDADAFYRYLFHECVEERISRCKLQRLPQCPHCYSCPKLHIIYKDKKCPAFLSYEDFAQMIGKEVDRSTISRAFSRDMAREEVPEITQMALPSPSVTIPVLHALLRDKVVNKEEMLALAQKTADGQLGNLTEEQRKQGWGPVKTLTKISGYLRAGTSPRGHGLTKRQRVPDTVRMKLIHTPNYGPAEAEWELERAQMAPKTKLVVTELKKYIKLAIKIDDYLETLRQDSRIKELDLVDFLTVLRLVAKHFNEFADFIEGMASETQ